MAQIDVTLPINVHEFYDPFPKQAELHCTSSRYPLGIGGWGSGKSSVLLGEALYNCFEFPQSESLLIRKNFPELEKGLIQDFKNTVPKELYRYNDSKHVATFANGSKLFFGHCKTGSEKDLAQYLSAAFVFIGWDELGQFSYDAWNFMSNRNRVNAGCQPSSDGYMPFCRMFGATNPMGPGYGWIKKLWIEGKPPTQLGDVKKIGGKWYSPVNDKGLMQNPDFRAKIIYHEGEPMLCVYDPGEYFYVHSTVLDNPGMMEKDPQYLERLMKLAPALRQKALHGDLNSIAGAYFTNFSYERNVLSLPRDREKIRFEAWQPIWLGFDWGLRHHTTVYWNTRAQVQAMDGKWRSCVVTYREMVCNENDYLAVRHQHGEKWSYKDFLCEEIRKRTPDAQDVKDGNAERDELSKVKYIFLSPERFHRTEDVDHPIAHELSELLHKMGLPRCSEANDSRIDGAVLMYNLIDAGEWLVSDTCPQLISSIETRTTDEKKLEDVLKVDDVLDDCYDGCRYGLASMLKPKGKPEDLKLQEKIQSIEDPTARMLYAFQHRDDAAKRNAPIKTKVRLPWQIKH